MPAHGQRPLQNPRRYPGAALLWLALLALTQLACGSTSPDPAVSRDLRSFFEAFVGRDLTSAELRDVTVEFIELHTAGGKTPDGIRDTARQLDAYSKTLRANA